MLSEPSFIDRWQQLDWQQINQQIAGQSETAVQQAIASPHLSRQQFMALLSPAARPYLEPLADKAQYLTRQRFGHVINFYIPLYLSNLCSNHCTYCGFSMVNKIKRTVLSKQEILDECAAIKKMGLQNILLVTGEHQGKVGMDYFRQALDLIRPHFSSLTIEVQPMLTEEYAELKQRGLDGVLVYQESYHLDTYDKHHLRGNKKDFFFRLTSQDRLGQAHIDKIGLGVLIGLSDDWRTDCYYLAEHLLYLQKRYWRSRFTLSFPRLRPCQGGIEPASVMEEPELLQVICAFRLLMPDVELSLSTRESPYFRDHMVPIAINQISANSSTQPGGYAHPENHQLAQFSPHDTRSLTQVTDAMIKAGMQPVWKDWEPYLGRH